MWYNYTMDRVYDSKTLYLLINKYIDGDEESFNEFYEALKRPVFYNILSYVQNYEIAEDILQDTFVQFLNSLSKVKKEKDIAGYIFTISRNLSLNHLNKNKKIVQNEEYLDIYASSADNTREEIEHNELLDKIKLILKSDEYQILVLHIMNELSFKEISKLLNIPIGTLTWKYQEAIKKVQAHT
ncbi:MAG: sigma-70 family RNA polymerase sigma factor [Bacilli bacterium]